mmetsp:Transcript_15728/g.23152  ORF Transcript_15728/g.23152 Transcript_15728/m.23152 type:complete len:86 (+) Transcript_15728:35-292(+)
MDNYHYHRPIKEYYRVRMNQVSSIDSKQMAASNQAPCTLLQYPQRSFFICSQQANERSAERLARPIFRNIYLCLTQCMCIVKAAT